MLTKQQFLNLANATDMNEAVETIMQFLEYHKIDNDYFINQAHLKELVQENLKDGWINVWMLFRYIEESRVDDDYYCKMYSTLEPVTTSILKDVIERIVQVHGNEIF